MIQWPTSAPESPFRAHTRWQAHWCTALGSPFTALLCTLIADRLDPAIPLGHRLDGWPGNPKDDALMLRVAGGLHATVRAGNPEIVKGDAADFVEARATPAEGFVTTVFHSFAFQYFPAPTQARIQAHMEQAGARASAEAPLAWLRFELEPGAPSDTPPALRLRLWPHGEDRLLARAHPHGSLVQWLA